MMTGKTETNGDDVWKQEDSDNVCSNNNLTKLNSVLSLAYVKQFHDKNQCNRLSTVICVLKGQDNVNTDYTAS